MGNRFQPLFVGLLLATLAGRAPASGEKHLLGEMIQRPPAAGAGASGGNKSVVLTLRVRKPYPSRGA
jgi:hypothetical protein